jgi:hypothetical protein
MHRRLLSLVLLWLTAAVLAQFGAGSQANAQLVSQAGPQGGVKLNGRSYGDLYAAQRTLLSSYCRLDFEGARLLPGGWERVKPYTALHFNPEFSRIVIVTRFDIEAPRQPSEELSVNYQSTGYYSLNEGYTPSPGKEHARFRMQQHGENLLMTEVAPETPYVSPKAAVAWMNLMLGDPKTPELERAHLKDAVEQLNKFLGR